jgi:tRNA/tmRNA/rRNA uracil-C5-methylase (TrmA/RlmC/RlmD family)
LTRHAGRIVGVFFYVDETKGRYYLGVKDPESPGRLQRIYGKKILQHRVGGKNFVFPPLAFAQINHSLLDILTEMAGTLLAPDPRGTLYDLYCGYGLFALTLAGRVRRTIGADIAPSSIEAARTNASRLAITNSRFLRSNLTPPSVAELVRDMSPSDVALLDPPRNGTAPGIIEIIASRKPQRVLHIFCNIDLLPQEVSRWRMAGYTMKDAVPVDMFPGTSSVEVLVLLTPS